MDIENNPFDTGAKNPGYDDDDETGETGENIGLDDYPTTSTRQGSEDTTNRNRHRTHEELRLLKA